MNYESCYVKNMLLAQSINEVREDMKPWQKCVAIYLNKKSIVSIGVNKSKTHPLLLTLGYEQSKYFSMEVFAKKKKINTFPLHAELDGYIKLLNNEFEYDCLCVYRGEDGSLPSEPCKVCSRWLSRINKLTVCFIDMNGNYVQILSEQLKGHQRNRVDEA